jgi:hypothetical protein
LSGIYRKENQVKLPEDNMSLGQPDQPTVFTLIVSFLGVRQNNPASVGFPFFILNPDFEGSVDVGVGRLPFAFPAQRRSQWCRSSAFVLMDEDNVHVYLKFSFRSFSTHEIKTFPGKSRI